MPVIHEGSGDRESKGEDPRVARAIRFFGLGLGLTWGEKVNRKV
jgi:hypothetical protein